MSAASILVAGIGNVFLGDDGFGVEVVRRLAHRALPPHVRTADFGIRGFDLAYSLLGGYELAILVDATRRAGPPGTLYVLEPREAGTKEGAALEPHGMVPTSALRLAESMGAKVGRVVVVGCEPESFGEPGIGRVGLSAPVAAAVDDALDMIERLVDRSTAAERTT